MKLTNSKMDWLLWVDIETTGLDLDTDVILQLACLLTNFDASNHTFIKEYTIACDAQTLTLMDEWCTKTHTESGLYKAALDSTTTIEQAESNIIAALNCSISLHDKLYIAGNSVHFDKKFIDKYLPTLSSRLSHKIVDISSIGLLCKNFADLLYTRRPLKKYDHTALSDILESIEEYKYYKTYFLCSTPSIASHACVFKPT
jgi:oligoribonuclease